MKLAYPIADQSFERSTSLGILNISLALLDELAGRPNFHPIFAYRDPALRLDSATLRQSSIVWRDAPIRKTAERIIWEQWGAIAAANRDGADWLFLPKGFSSFVRRPTPRLAAYVHDIMAVTYFDRYPAHGGRFKQAYFARALAATLRHASAVFTNTEFTKGEILGWARRRGIGIRAAVDVAGYGSPDAQPPPGNRADLIACDIRDAPHKRSDIAIEFLLRWCRDTRFAGRIVFIGKPPKHLPAPSPPSWEFAGRVTPERYAGLMRSALAHVHFTEYEGFGLPPVEATMFGTPPVYSEIEVTSEVMRGTGCPFKNSSYTSFADAMDRGLHSSPAEILGWQQVLGARHSWRDVGNRVVATLECK